MEKFFNAQSVAVIGVSEAEDNLGRIMALNLMAFGYTGLVHLVGSQGGAFLGHGIYKSVVDVPHDIDLATVLVPASAVPGVLRECARKGIRRVVVQSGGFGELGEDRKALEEDVRRLLKEHGMRLIGPNCLGVINRHNGLAVPFLPLQPEAPAGQISIVAQSGGVGAQVLNALGAEGIGFSKFASIGNKLDVNEADILDYLVRDGDTGIIYCYLEGIAAGRRLMEIAAASSKPIILHKANTSRWGGVIARSHSASLAADDAVVEAALHQCGVLRVKSQQDALNAIKAFLLPPMKGNRLAVISRSGGHAVMAADAAGFHGFDLPPFPEGRIACIRSESRANVICMQNPMDLGDVYHLPAYLTLLQETMNAPETDGIVFIFNYQSGFYGEDCRRFLLEVDKLAATAQKPLAVCLFTDDAEYRWVRKSAHMHLFHDPASAVEALALSRDHHGRKILPFPSVRPFVVDSAPIIEKTPDGPHGGEPSDAAPRPLPPEELAHLLTSYGIPLVAWERADSEGQTVAAARRLGFPVVLKTARPDVIHKSDAGAVFLDLRDDGAVRRAYTALQKISPSVLIQAMAPEGVEWFVGGRQDAHFGPVLISGLGGVYVEAFGRVSFRVCPVAEEEARSLLDECFGSALLSGVRGRPPLDREGLIRIMVRLSWLLTDFRNISDVDFNPIRVYPERCLVVDWRAVAEGRSSSERRRVHGND